MKKKVIIILSCLILASILLTLFINIYMVESTKLQIVNNKKIDKVDAILVLGCKAYPDRPSMMLEKRLNKAIEVYNEFNTKILLSGDHGTKDYDEIKIMGNYMLENNIPENDLFVDHAGFNTYDSIYRAKYIFNAKKIVIVTQKYHMYRALYIANKLGIEAYGIVADNIPYKSIMYKNYAREIFSRDKNFFKTIIKPKSKYLGDKIDLTGNGNINEK